MCCFRGICPRYCTVLPLVSAVLLLYDGTSDYGIEATCKLCCLFYTVDKSLCSALSSSFYFYMCVCARSEDSRVAPGDVNWSSNLVQERLPETKV